MNIHIIKVLSSEMRYDTAGDWYYETNGDLTIKVATDCEGFPTEDHQNLVAIHELIEVLLCQKRGVTQQQVDTFDTAPEVVKAQVEDEDLEPGDLPDAPYRKEHRFAMIVEHMLAHELGLVGYGTIR